MPFGRAALKSLAINTADEINHNGIAGLHGSRFSDRFGRAVFIRQLFQRLLHLFIRNRNRPFFNSNALEIDFFNLWHDFNRHHGFQIAAFFVFGDVQRWVGGETQFFLSDDGIRRFINSRLNNLTQHLLAVTGFHYAHRHFTGAKAGHFHLRGQGCDAFINFCADFRGG